MKNEQSTSLYSVYLSRAKVSSMFSVCCLLPLLSAWAIYDRLCRLCKGSRGMERGGAQAHSKWLTASAMRVSLRLCRWGGSIPFTLVSDYTQVSSPSYAVSPSPNCRSLFWQIYRDCKDSRGVGRGEIDSGGINSLSCACFPMRLCRRAGVHFLHFSLRLHSDLLSELWSVSFLSYLHKSLLTGYGDCIGRGEIDSGVINSLSCAWHVTLWDCVEGGVHSLHFWSQIALNFQERDPGGWGEEL